MKIYKFFESNVDIDKMANAITKYLNEYDSDDSDFYDFEYMIRSHAAGENDEDPYYFEGDLDTNRVKKSLSELFKYIKPGFRDYEKFMNFYYEIEDMVSVELPNNEIIEDLFLDLDNKVEISKKRINDKLFIRIFIMDVEESKVPTLFNRVWTSVKKRLPEGCQIHTYEVERSNEGTYNVKILIDSDKSNIYED